MIDKCLRLPEGSLRAGVILLVNSRPLFYADGLLKRFVSLIVPSYARVLISPVNSGFEVKIGFWGRFDLNKIWWKLNPKKFDLWEARCLWKLAQQFKVLSQETKAKTKEKDPVKLSICGCLSSLISCAKFRVDQSSGKGSEGRISNVLVWNRKCPFKQSSSRHYTIHHLIKHAAKLEISQRSCRWILRRVQFSKVDRVPGASMEY